MILDAAGYFGSDRAIYGTSRNNRKKKMKWYEELHEARTKDIQAEMTMATNREQAQDSNSALLGYWAAQEQYSMHDLLQFVAEAEKNGFTTTITSDHFHPWWHDNAYGNFAWIWIAAAAERTKRMQFVTGVTAPIYRYHPAIIAQAFASLDILYPGRIGLGLGTGESMNETPLGFDWPRPKTRLKRMIEAAQIISKLWHTRTNKDNNNNEGKKTSNYYPNLIACFSHMKNVYDAAISRTYKPVDTKYLHLWKLDVDHES